MGGKTDASISEISGDLAPFNRILESLTSGILLLDSGGRILSCNTAAQDILGLSREQIVHSDTSRPCWKITTDEGAPCLHANTPPLSDVFARGSSFQRFECVLQHADSGKRRLGFNASPIYNACDQIGGALIEFADITDRKQNEREQERLLAELEATIHSITDAVIIYQPSGSIVRMNPAAERLLGYGDAERKAPLEQRLAHLKVSTPQGRPFPLRRVMARALGGETLQGEIVVLHRQDAEIWLSASAAPIRGADGALLGVVGTATDITPLRMLQEEQAVSLHAISHDLRSPLTVISGHAKLLQDSLQHAGIKNKEIHLDAILQGVRQMNHMLEGLAETARLEGGGASYRHQRIEVSEFVHNLLSRLEPVLQNGHFAVDVPPELPTVWADPSGLERILLNLINNALRYSPLDRPVQIAARQSQEAQMVEITVRDQGPGLMSEDADHLFERFYRGSQKSGKEDHQGLGLGLYICHRLVEMQRGRIRVESTPGKGCAFFFTLPVAESP